MGWTKKIFTIRRSTHRWPWSCQALLYVFYMQSYRSNSSMCTARSRPCVAYNRCTARMIDLTFLRFSFMNNDYKIESSENITDWMLRPALLPVKDNFDQLLKGFIETPGRMVQPSYNFHVILPRTSTL